MLFNRLLERDVRLDRMTWLMLIVSFAGAMHLPSANMGGTGMSLYFNLYVMMIVVPASFLLLSFRRPLRLDRTALVLALLLLILTLPVLDQADLSDVVYRLLAAWFGLVFYLLLLQCRSLSVESCLAILVVSCLLQSLYGLVQLLWLYDGNWLQFAEDRRPVGVFQQVNVLASYVATGLIAAAALFVYSRRPVHRWLALAMALLGPTLLLLILSRAALLGLGLALLMLVVYHWRCRAEVELRHWWAALGLGFVVASLVLFARASSGSAARSVTSFTSGGARINDYAHSLWMLLQKPWAGWGYGNFDSAFLYSWVSRRAEGDDIGLVSRQLQHPHNELLLWGVEGGLPLIIALVTVLVLFVYWAFRARGSGAWLSLALLVPLSVHAMLELPFYHSIVHWLVFVLLLWVVMKDVTPVRSFTPPLHKAIPVLGVIAALAALLFLVTAYQTSRFISRVYVEQSYREVNWEQTRNPYVLSDYQQLGAILQRLDLALDADHSEALRPALSDAERYLETDPNSNLLVRTIVAYNRLGDTEAAGLNLALGQLAYEGEYPFDRQRSLDYFVLRPSAAGDSLRAPRPASAAAGSDPAPGRAW